MSRLGVILHWALIVAVIPEQILKGP